MSRARRRSSLALIIQGRGAVNDALSLSSIGLRVGSYANAIPGFEEELYMATAIMVSEYAADNLGLMPS